MSMDKKPIIIFDFDGTVADSFEEVFRAFNDMSGKYGYKRVKPEEIEEFKNFSSREILKKFNIPRWKLFFILWEGKKRFNKEISQINLFPGIKEALKKLEDEKCILGILSSNSQKNVREFLAHNQIDSFDFIYSKFNLFGKAEILKKIIKERKFDQKEVFYVGDETRDVEAARHAGVISVAVAWGFNSREILAQHHPDYLLDKPDDLLKIMIK